jgi:dienelactone hydrolase
MLRRLFHTWEHRLADATPDRRVRPFEWGLEWLPPSGHARDADTHHSSAGIRLPRDPTRGSCAVQLEPGPAGHPELMDPASDADRVHTYVSRALADTNAYFTPEPTTSYQLSSGPGEARLLRFRSALDTPHPENNVVHARYFPGRTKSGARARRAVLVLPQWNSDAQGHVGLAKLLARFGMSALRLSMPYHDARMPSELHRADYIVSANVLRTLEVCRQAVLDARRAIWWLRDQGYERIGILGTSLGSCLSMLTAVHEPLVRAQALNHVSPFFADVVWRGLSTRHVREGLDGRITVDELRRLWMPISPWNYLDRVRTPATLLVYARYDLTFPVDLSRTLIGEFRRRGIPHEVAALPCGHYSSGAAPFKYMDAYVLTRFLQRNL